MATDCTSSYFHYFNVQHGIVNYFKCSICSYRSRFRFLQRKREYSLPVRLDRFAFGCFWFVSVSGFLLWVLFSLCCVFIYLFCVLVTHVLGKMAASAPRRVFAHKRTVRLIIDDDMRINSLEVIASLPEYQADITGVVPLFGGKCINITLRDHEVAARLCHKWLWFWRHSQTPTPPRRKTYTCFVFCTCGIPRQRCVGTFKTIWRAENREPSPPYFQEEGFSHIERGICLAELTKINRDLPRRIVTQGVEINFKYTGQPITCYRCNSTEHVVRNCDKQHRVKPTVNQRLTASGGGGKPYLVPLYPRQQLTTQLPKTWIMKLRRRPRNPRSRSRWATHRSPTQMKNFHLPRPRATFSIPPLSQENGPPRHRRNRTIPNQSNNVLRRLLLPMTQLSNSCIQPRNRRVSNAKNWRPLSLARNITGAALCTFNTALEILPT